MHLKRHVIAVMNVAAIAAAAMLLTCSNPGDSSVLRPPLRYTLGVAVSPTAGGAVTVDGSPTTGTTTHNSGTSVQVCAAAASGYAFTGWSGASTSTSSCVTLTMSSHRMLTANFQQRTQPTIRTLTVTRSPAAGGYVIVNGYTAAETTTHTDGASVRVCATAESGYAFTGWSGGLTSTSSCVTITMNGNVSLTANFQLQTQPTTYTLTVTRSPAAGGSVTVDGSPTTGTTTHNNGASVQVCAAAASGYTFTGWSGGLTSTSSCVTITMRWNMSLTAIFQQTAMYTLTTNVSPSGGGSVSRSPNATSYAAGTNVTVTATAASGYTFTGWSGASTSTSSSVTITMSSSRTLTANFQQMPSYTLTVYRSPTDGGLVTINGTPTTGTTTHTDSASVQVCAIASSGYTFTRWSGASTSTSSCVTLTMSSNRTLTAAFQAQGGSITDARDGGVYSYVRIDNRDWFAENLNYQTGDSWCYGDDPSNCGRYGRLYTWDAAMTACPAGWRLPSNAEWTELVHFVSTTSTNNAGTMLRSTSRWNTGSGYIAGTDDFEFSALPGGLRYSDGSFNDIGFYGYWWSATEYDAGSAWYRDMGYGSSSVFSGNWDKADALSVRCLRD